MPSPRSPPPSRSFGPLGQRPPLCHPWAARVRCPMPTAAGSLGDRDLHRPRRHRAGPDVRVGAGARYQTCVHPQEKVGMLVARVHALLLQKDQLGQCSKRRSLHQTQGSPCSARPPGAVVLHQRVQVRSAVKGVAAGPGTSGDLFEGDPVPGARQFGASGFDSGVPGPLSRHWPWLWRRRSALSSGGGGRPRRPSPAPRRRPPVPRRPPAGAAG